MAHLRAVLRAGEARPNAVDLSDAAPTGVFFGRPKGEKAPPPQAPADVPVARFMTPEELNAEILKLHGVIAELTSGNEKNPTNWYTVSGNLAYPLNWKTTENDPEAWPDGVPQPPTAIVPWEVHRPLGLNGKPITRADILEYEKYLEWEDKLTTNQKNAVVSWRQNVRNPAFIAANDELKQLQGAQRQTRIEELKLIWGKVDESGIHKPDRSKS